MPDANTVQQINQWYRNEPLTAGHLNQMVNAINFLLKTTGYLLNRTALANYSSSDASDTNYSGIIEKVTVKSDATAPAITYGNLILPPLSGINGIVWDASITQPEIIDNVLHLNPAEHAPFDPSDASSVEIARPGYISSVESFFYDPSDTSISAEKKKSRISNGKIIIPIPEQKFSVEYVYDAGATPGSDGWVQTLYIWGLYTGDIDHMYATRQLMRVSGSTLQVVQQISYDGNTWSESSTNG